MCQNDVKRASELPWSCNWKERFPEANKHEIDMLEGKYGTYARSNFRREVESGDYVLGTMT